MNATSFSLEDLFTNIESELPEFFKLKCDIFDLHPDGMVTLVNYKTPQFEHFTPKPNYATSLIKQNYGISTSFDSVPKRNSFNFKPYNSAPKFDSAPSKFIKTAPQKMHKVVSKAPAVKAKEEPEIIILD